jgi:hypothetical protein
MVDGTSNCKHRFENRRGQCRDRAAQGNSDRLALDLRELASPEHTAALTSANSLDHSLLDHPSLHIARTVRNALADPVAQRTIAHPSPGVNGQLAMSKMVSAREWASSGFSTFGWFSVGGHSELGGPHRGTVPISSFDRRRASHPPLAGPMVDIERWQASWTEPYGSLTRADAGYHQQGQLVARKATSPQRRSCDDDAR